MMVGAADNPSRWGCPRTVQGMTVSATQMFTQSCYNCSNLHDGDNIAIVWHGITDRLQASGNGARKVLDTTPDMKSVMNIVK